MPSQTRVDNNNYNNKFLNQYLRTNKAPFSSRPEPQMQLKMTMKRPKCKLVLFNAVGQK